MPAIKKPVFILSIALPARVMPHLYFVLVVHDVLFRRTGLFWIFWPAVKLGGELANVSKQTLDANSSRPLNANSLANWLAAARGTLSPLLRLTAASPLPPLLPDIRQKYNVRSSFCNTGSTHTARFFQLPYSHH